MKSYANLSFGQNPRAKRCQGSAPAAPPEARPRRGGRPCEERWRVERRALEEVELHMVLERADGQDVALGRPHGRAPLPLFDEIGRGSADHRPDPGDRLAAPVAQLVDVGGDLIGWGHEIGSVVERREDRVSPEGWSCIEATVAVRDAGCARGSGRSGG
jgi:hypothetical protein